MNKLIQSSNLRNEQQHEMAKDYEEYVCLTAATQPFHASLVMPEVAKENPSALSTQLDIFDRQTFYCIKHYNMNNNHD